MVSHFVFASHAYFRSARVPLPKLFVAARAWPSPLASAPDPKPPHRHAQLPRPRLLLDRIRLYSV
eukprot:6202825-Pleurochrysis_carterae.AAC.2